MNRPSLIALAIASASLLSCASTSAQGKPARAPQTEGAATTAATPVEGQQDPALRAHKEQLEQELQALKKQQKELNALVEKLKAKASAEADQAANAQKAAADEAKQQQKAQRADQERRERDMKARIERIERRVETEIQRVRANAKKEIDKAMAEAKNGEGLEVVLDDVTSPAAPGQPMFVLPDATDGKTFAIAVEGERAEPKPKDGANKSPKVARTRIVEGKPLAGRVVEGKPIAGRIVEGSPLAEIVVEGMPIEGAPAKALPQQWGEVREVPMEQGVDVFIAGEDGLPNRRTSVRGLRIVQHDGNNDRDASCCDCECPMCGDGHAQRNARPMPQRQQQFPDRMQPRMDAMREEARRRMEQRFDQRRRVMEFRGMAPMHGNAQPERDRLIERAMDARNDPEVARLIEALRNRLGERGGNMEFRARMMEPSKVQRQFEVDVEQMEEAPMAPPPVRLRATRTRKPDAAPAPQTEETPIEVRRVRTKKPSNVAPVPMPPAAPEAPAHVHHEDVHPSSHGGGD